MSTAIPGRLLPHRVTKVRPVERRDSYGSTTYDYGPAAERTDGIRAWLEQSSRRELTGATQDGRTTQDQRWLMVLGDPDVRPTDRIEWQAPGGLLVFELDGPPAPLFSPFTGQHHTEASLRIITG